MAALEKGANCPLVDAEVRVTISGPTALDVAALLLTEAGKVRSDDDFVFYNNPTGPGVQHSTGGDDDGESVAISTSEIPAEIDRIVVTASLDGSGPQTFGELGPVTATVTGASGELATFTATQLSTETALVLVEVYRRADAWKLRAVGQGYSNGLAGIATDFGVAVEEEAAATPIAPPPTPESLVPPALPDPPPAEALTPPAPPDPAPAEPAAPGPPPLPEPAAAAPLTPPALPEADASDEPDAEQTPANPIGPPPSWTGAPSITLIPPSVNPS